MLNNVQSKVAISNSRHPKARFNLSHDVNSTYQFGETQPVVAKFMQPDEKDVVSINSMVRLSPMLAPTFGRIKHKEWHHFIPMTDLFPHFGNYLAGTPYKGNIPVNLPHMTLGLLSYFCLVGSKMTMYVSQESSTLDPDDTKVYLYKNEDVSTTTQDIDNLLAWIMDYQGLTVGTQYPFDFKSHYSSSIWSVADANVINLKYLINPNLIHYGGSFSDYNDLYIPTTNFDTVSWFDYDDKDVSGSALQFVTDLDPVSLESADAVIPYWISGLNHERTLYLAFRMSNFGKRLYKLLIGLGYQLDFTSSQKVSLMPLFAYYKAWVDQFGLTRYKTWKDTTAYKLLTEYDYMPNQPNFDSIFYPSIGNNINKNDWIKFIVELGNTFVTEDLDFVSAHTTQEPTLSAPGNNLQLDVMPSLMNPRIDDALGQPPAMNYGFATLAGQQPNNTELVRGTPELSLSGRLDGFGVRELLKLWKWVNRNSVAGREIEKLLQAQGYGYYLYSCKSNFIGYTEQSVPIYDVVNSSDTYNGETNQGMLLGEYAGRGLGYEESKTMTFEAQEHGYWIGLCAIVPESGYSQGIDPSVLALNRWQQYQPEFDGFGYEITPKNVVCGSLPFSGLGSQDYDLLTKGFGFVPRYSGMKVARNVSNGGFSLRGTRSIFQPYMLDKFIDVGERAVSIIDDTSSRTAWQMRKVFKQGFFPVAGDYWRYVNRYTWLGNLDRIFARASGNVDVLGEQSLLDSALSDTYFEYCIQSDDNFIVHHVINQQAYAHMLPISESYDTEDDENGSFNDSVEHA